MAAVTAPSLQTPPPGIPRLFWNKILANPHEAELLRFLKGEGGERVGKGKWHASKHDKVFGLGGKTPQQVLQELAVRAQNEWNNTDETLQADYVKSSNEGLKYDPYSTQGLNEQQLNEDRARYDAALGEHTQDVGEQRQNLYKLKAQSDPHITAEEKLMMEMTRREADADYKGKVGATMNEMQARGMSGSGAELTRNLAGASDSANRHAIEALGAQANAQKRAMDSLGKASDLSSTMATQSGADATNANNALNADQDTQFTLANDAEVEKKLK